MTAPVRTDPPTSRRRRLAGVVAIALVLVLLAELGVRAIEPALPSPAGWPDLATATKIAQLEREADHGCTDVVFVGNSMSRDGFVPPIFEDADPAGRSAYNASLDAASPTLLLRWVRDEVLPRADPATVVIGVTSFDLNDAASTPAAARRSFDDAPYTATGAAAEVEAAFTRALALVRNRESLRDPGTVIAAVDDRLAGDDAERPDASGIPDVIAPEGHGVSRRDLEFAPAPSTIDRLRQQFLEPFEIGGVQADALRDLVEAVEASGAQPVVVVLPVTGAYVDAHPDGPADLRAFRAALDDALERTTTVLVEAPDQPEDAFADTHHLNATGADRLSASLPALLGDRGVPTSGCTA